MSPNDFVVVIVLDPLANAGFVVNPIGPALLCFANLLLGYFWLGAPTVLGLALH